MASAGQDGESPEGAANGGHDVRGRVRRGTEVARGKYGGSAAEHLWRRLDSMDFINRGMLFAATLLLCFSRS
jgi:membrane protein